MPCTLSILTNVFSTDRDRGRAIGIWSATAGLGVAIGPILGGFLLVRYWWGSVFLINVPIAAAGGLAAIFLVPNSRNLQAKRPDPVGALLSIAGLGLLLWAIIEAPGRTWSAPPIAGALAASAALIAAFIVWENRRTDPMLPVSFFRRRRYSAAIASLALVLFALLGLLFLMTQYLQFVLGFSAYRAGLAIAPVALVLLVTAPFSAVLARRIGTKSVIVPGLLLIALGLGFLSQTTVGDGYRWCLPFFLLIGCGVGLALAPSTDSVMGSVPKEEAGVGSATSDTSMQVGGALGVAVLGTALNLRYQHLMLALIGHHAVPPAIHDVILGSLGGALQVAARIPGPAGAALADAARRSFVSGMDLGLLIASIVVAAAACVVLLALPQRPSPPGTPTQAPGRPRAGNPASRSLPAAGSPPANAQPKPWRTVHKLHRYPRHARQPANADRRPSNPTVSEDERGFSVSGHLLSGLSPGLTAPAAPPPGRIVTVGGGADEGQRHHAYPGQRHLAARREVAADRAYERGLRRSRARSDPPDARGRGRPSTAALDRRRIRGCSARPKAGPRSASVFRNCSLLLRAPSRGFPG